MHVVIPAPAPTARSCRRGRRHLRPDVDPVNARHHRHGLPAVEPVSHDVDRENVAGWPETEPGRGRQERSTSSRSPGREPWGTRWDRPDRPGRPSGGQQQRCASPGDRGRNCSLLMDEPALRSTRSRRWRSRTRSTSFAPVHDRHRHAQHAAGRPGVGPPPSSTASIGLAGRLVEVGDAEDLFSNLDEQATEDYFSRFG